MNAPRMPVVRCPKCDVPYVLRVAISLATGLPGWVYQRDCSHRVTADARIDGEAPLPITGPD